MYRHKYIRPPSLAFFSKVVKVKGIFIFIVITTVNNFRTVNP